MDTSQSQHHASQAPAVLIVGAGPVGLMSGLLLARLGVKSLIVERRPARLRAPKAHALNPRSLEICRRGNGLGVGGTKPGPQCRHGRIQHLHRGRVPMLGDQRASEIDLQFGEPLLSNQDRVDGFHPADRVEDFQYPLLFVCPQGQEVRDRVCQFTGSL